MSTSNSPTVGSVGNCPDSPRHGHPTKRGFRPSSPRSRPIPQALASASLARRRNVTPSSRGVEVAPLHHPSPSRAATFAGDECTVGRCPSEETHGRSSFPPSRPNPRRILHRCFASCAASWRLVPHFVSIQTSSLSNLCCRIVFDGKRQDVPFVHLCVFGKKRPNEKERGVSHHFKMQTANVCVRQQPG